MRKSSGKGHAITTSARTSRHYCNAFGMNFQCPLLPAEKKGEAPMKWDGYPNLRMRPPAPAEGRGRIQIRIRRAFTASGAEALTSSQIYDWTHVRRRQRDKTLPAGTYSRTTRTLRAMCEPVGRGTSRGRPILWRLRNSGVAIDAALSRPAPPCGVGKMAKRKMLFHRDYLREKIPASKLINRLQ